MAITTLSSLVASGYALKHEGVRADLLSLRDGLSETELKELFLDYLVKNTQFKDVSRKELITYYLNGGRYEVLCYADVTGALCLSIFQKLDDKFEDSTFIVESDKEIISKIIGRYDSIGQPIYLGDTVQSRDVIGRVIWSDSGFCIYNDIQEQIEFDLSNDSKMIKI